MRLTHIKLAGFKSFVDPTSIPVPGQLIGIVGPNGCGKSNVIDAVRWVLGESSARHLRGETMQDVIFNGSGGRKPVSRTSVELVFDNSLGKAAGQWSSYAEIAVKRVLTRNGDSSYYINNLHVRRRDVTDIFMGTGLGARAYAIIEQGMISRVIEAKPEELRIFLEEAAGISIYKERRRETELRLRDTRDNMLRINDIRQELEQQLQRLEAQAQVAQHYHKLQGELETAQNILWLLKKREAVAQWERAQREVQRLVNELEAETARLRQAENQLEQTRAAHYQASDALHAAQSEVYAANAEVAQLEQQLQHLRENRQRISSQTASLQQQQAQLAGQRQEAETNLAHWRAEQQGAQQRVTHSAQQLEQARAGLPLAENEFRDCQRRYSELQRSMADAEQARRVEETHFAHAEKTLQQLQARLARLEQEKSQLQRPDGEAAQRNREELDALATQLEQARQQLSQAQSGLTSSEQSWREAQRSAQEALQQQTRLEARLHALQQLQSNIGRDEKLNHWLAKHGLDSLQRLWQNLKIDAGWDTALESVLRERLNALVVDDLARVQSWLDDAPPALMTLLESSADSTASENADNGLTPLRRRVAWSGSGSAAFLDDWLHGVYTVASGEEGLALRAALPPGAALVCPAGHLFTRHSASFHAPQSELHGVLARQREIETLQAEALTLKAQRDQREAAAADAEQALVQIKAHLATCQTELTRLQQQHHRVQLEAQKIAQIEQHYTQRVGQIEREMGEITQNATAETAQQQSSAANLREQRMQIETLLEHVQDAKRARFEAENQVNQQRQVLQSAEREAQEAVFNEKNCINKINELENLVKVSNESGAGVKQALENLLAELGALDEEPLKEGLQQALEIRRQRELKLAEAREALTAAANSLQEIEQQRMRSEQSLHPLRDKLEQSRLKEQEARLSDEQCSAQLQAAGANEAELAATLEKQTRPSAAQAEIERLKQEIEALGAVNLAALEELNSAVERKQYLDAQAEDLNQAVETLEQAIRKIDKETRGRLQETFDTVNGHFGELFPTIFGGGQAQLILTGEEILDAGVQLFAQPPGKKNNSIHLLSGGEKALTALALVFALFRLNPAPFCLLDEVDAPLDDTNTERFCELVRKMSQHTQFMFVTHNKITMELSQQLIGVTMPELGVSRIVAVDVEGAMRLQDAAVA